MKDHLSALVQKANLGDREALEQVLLKIKDLVYNLSLKMLLFPEDAKDATQEILIKVVTHLSTFNHKSQFKTWVYRIATNYLLNHKGKRSKEFAMPFKDYTDLIDLGHSNEVRYTKNEGELSLLEEEVKVSCTQGLLLCLNEIDRMVYILTDILGFNGVEGSEILGISSENYRQKLSRSRAKVRSFLNNKCGLVNPENPCRCTKKIDFLIDQKIVNPKDLRFAHFSDRSIDLVGRIDDLEKSVAIYRSTPNFPAPEELLEEIKTTLKIN
ncbi:RNA polymerase sigma factor [Costertonia aggregata]|uniref:RNA polymerase sigma factor n=1 Tax=Costertonia aggregata TaxID=343403 RepID=A0A7H9AQT0_9FLAO|nr:RNA polymerase sigma factor [Costertonia aggregata]QLG45851.1 RNA polymerase sigma factor [Costertonia aggregata]